MAIQFCDEHDALKRYLDKLRNSALEEHHHVDAMYVIGTGIYRYAAWKNNLSINDKHREIEIEDLTMGYEEELKLFKKLLELVEPEFEQYKNALKPTEGSKEKHHPSPKETKVKIVVQDYTD